MTLFCVLAWANKKVSTFKILTSWLGWEDSNRRNARVKVWCLTTWLQPNIFILWGERWDSNPRPPGPQPGALTNWAIPTKSGEPEGIRTPDLRLRRPLLYPTELLAQALFNVGLRSFGAGDGNRTHAASLEGWNSTIELHPHKSQRFAII